MYAQYVKNTMEALNIPDVSKDKRFPWTVSGPALGGEREGAFPPDLRPRWLLTGGPGLELTLGPTCASPDVLTGSEIALNVGRNTQRYLSIFVCTFISFLNMSWWIVLNDLWDDGCQWRSLARIARVLELIPKAKFYVAWRYVLGDHRPGQPCGEPSVPLHSEATKASFSAAGNRILAFSLILFQKSIARCRLPWGGYVLSRGPLGRQQCGQQRRWQCPHRGQCRAGCPGRWGWRFCLGLLPLRCLRRPLQGECVQVLQAVGMLTRREKKSRIFIIFNNIKTNCFILRLCECRCNVYIFCTLSPQPIKGDYIRGFRCPMWFT